MSTEKTGNVLFETIFSETPEGITFQASSVAPTGPAIIYFPGNNIVYCDHRQLINIADEINRIVNILKHNLENANLSQDIIRRLPFYAVARYSTLNFDTQAAVDLLYKKHGRTKGMCSDIKKLQQNNPYYQEEFNPAHIGDIYEQIIRPRISCINGRLDAKQAEQNVGQLVIFAHCYGAYTALKLEEVMYSKMQNLGYSDDEIAQIQKQITVIAYAPACPLGVSKMNFVSFKTLGDTFIKGGNSAYDYMDSLAWKEKQYCNDLLNNGYSEIKPLDFKLSFYPDKLGNVFIIKEKFTYDPLKTTELSHASEEHNHSFNQGNTQDANTMQQIMSRCLVNAVLHAFDMQKELLSPLSIQDLVVGKASLNQDKDLLIFKKACLSGKRQYKQMVNTLLNSAKSKFAQRKCSQQK